MDMGRRNWRSLAAAFCVALVGCGEFPRDSEGTLDRIKRDRTLIVGLAAPLAPERLDGRAESLVQQIAAETGATVRLQQGHQEMLFDRLEQGEVDIVLGRFEAKSPWATLVSFGPPLVREKQGKTEFHLTAAMRNGENALISLVEREARNVAPDAQ